MSMFTRKPGTPPRYTVAPATPTGAYVEDSQTGDAYGPASREFSHRADDAEALARRRNRTHLADLYLEYFELTRRTGLSLAENEDDPARVALSRYTAAVRGVVEARSPALDTEAMVSACLEEFAEVLADPRIAAVLPF